MSICRQHIQWAWFGVWWAAKRLTPKFHCDCVPWMFKSSIWWSYQRLVLHWLASCVGWDLYIRYHTWLESPRIIIDRKCYSERWLYMIVDSHDEEAFMWSLVGLMVMCLESFLRDWLWSYHSNIDRDLSLEQHEAYSILHFLPSTQPIDWTAEYCIDISSTSSEVMPNHPQIEDHALTISRM